MHPAYTTLVPLTPPRGGHFHLLTYHACEPVMSLVCDIFTHLVSICQTAIDLFHTTFCKWNLFVSIIFTSWISLELYLIAKWKNMFYPLQPLILDLIFVLTALVPLWSLVGSTVEYHNNREVPPLPPGPFGIYLQYMCHACWKACHVSTAILLSSKWPNSKHSLYIYTA